MISRGFARGGESDSAKKAHMRKVRNEEVLEVQAMSKAPRLSMNITFLNADLESCQHPHDDPLEVRVIIANRTIYRVLIDNGSSADIIFAFAFDKMDIGRDKLEPVKAHLLGFSGEKELPVGSIQLVLAIRDPPC